MKKPDGDNLEKFLNDSLNGVLWDDDSKITWLYRSKTITDSKQGETVIFVREMSNGPADYELILSDIVEHMKVGENVA
jgi:Holliday junction resolvase RusA-like endonuclease